MGVALRRLRRLARDGGEPELDVEATIERSARDGGEIDLVLRPPRANRVKLLLLMDVGGSMDPHAALCERLFSATHAASHFAAFEHYFFHNCPYERLHKDMTQRQGVSTDEILKYIDSTWTVVMVGDAYMHPFELTHTGGAIYYGDHNQVPGIEWLTRIRDRVPRSVWLNPEHRRIWNAPSVRLVRGVFPMFELSLEGLDAAVDVLRGAHTLRPSTEVIATP